VLIKGIIVFIKEIIEAYLSDIAIVGVSGMVAVAVTVAVAAADIALNEVCRCTANHK
jgi:NH3-dependent NAD+ synthetase